MFSGITEVEILASDRINQTVVSDMNVLLLRQHSKATPLTVRELLQLVSESRVVIASLDGRVVGMGQIVRIRCLSHRYAGIHNLVVHHHVDVLSIGSRILQKFLEGDYLKGIEFVQAHAWDREDNIINLLGSYGFAPRQKMTFRIKLAQLESLVCPQ